MPVHAHTLLEKANFLRIHQVLAQQSIVQVYNVLAHQAPSYHFNPSFPNINQASHGIQVCDQSEHKVLSLKAPYAEVPSFIKAQNCVQDQMQELGKA